MSENKIKRDIKPVSRRSATIANLVRQYVTIALSLINGFVLVPLYLKYIDFKLYGAWLATGSIVAWLAIVDAGLGDIVRQQTARVYGAKDFEQAGKTIGTGLFCMVLAGLLPALIALAISPFLPRIFNLEGTLASSLCQSFFLAGLFCSLVIIGGSASAVQEALQQNITICIIHTTGSVIGIVTTVWMLVTGYGLISIPIGLVIRGVIWTIAHWACMLYFCWTRLRIRLRVSKTNLLEIASLTTYSFFYKVSLDFLGQCDALIVGLFLGAEATPVFVLTKRLWDLLREILHKINVAFLPGLAHLYGEGDFVKFKIISRRLMYSVMYSTVIGTGLCIIFNKIFVNIWVGAKLYVGRPFDFLMGISTVMLIFIFTVNKVLFATGNIKGPAVVGIIHNVWRVVLLVLMVWLWGIVGVAISLVVTSIAFAIFYFIRQWIRMLNITGKEFGIQLIHLLKIFVIAILLSYIISRCMMENSWFWLFVTASINIILLGCISYVLDKTFRKELNSYLFKLQKLLTRKMR